MPNLTRKLGWTIRTKVQSSVYCFLPQLRYLDQWSTLLKSSKSNSKILFWRDTLQEVPEYFRHAPLYPFQDIPKVNYSLSWRVFQLRSSFATNFDTFILEGGSLAMRGHLGLLCFLTRTTPGSSKNGGLEKLVPIESKATPYNKLSIYIYTCSLWKNEKPCGPFMATRYPPAPGLRGPIPKISDYKLLICAQLTYSAWTS